MIGVAVVGYGLAGRSFHCPLVQRQPGLKLVGIVARDPVARAEATARWGPGVAGYASLDQALDDPAVELVVIATPHDTHAELAVRTLEAGKHCVVDKVMALGTADADRMIAARDRSGRMLSVFHNRRWDWDYATVRKIMALGVLGRVRIIESAVCRHAAPRSWRGQAASAGSILHDWGAHLADQVLLLGLGPCRGVCAWILDGPWKGVDSGGHGRIVMDFDHALVQLETSRITRIDRPRWWIVGDGGGFVKNGVDPQEEALRGGDLDAARESDEHIGRVTVEDPAGSRRTYPVESERPSWDAYYENIALHLRGQAPLAVTAEQAREVVRVLEAADRSAREHAWIPGPFGIVARDAGSRMG